MSLLDFKELFLPENEFCVVKFYRTSLYLRTAKAVFTC